ncbi:MAG: hypothetical protein ABSH36_09185, partial [Solirubrobacteraceae bacterium]
HETSSKVTNREDQHTQQPTRSGATSSRRAGASANRRSEKLHDAPCGALGDGLDVVVVEGHGCSLWERGLAEWRC